MEAYLKDALAAASAALANANLDELLQDFLEFEEHATGPTVDEMFGALNKPTHVVMGLAEHNVEDFDFAPLLTSGGFRQCEVSMNSTSFDPYLNPPNHWVTVPNECAIPIFKMKHHRSSNFTRYFNPLVTEGFSVSVASQQSVIGGCMQKIVESLASFVSKTCSTYNHSLNEDDSTASQSSISRAA